MKRLELILGALLALLAALPATAAGYTGSIPVDQDKEDAAYAQAKVTLADAMQTALTEVPGKAFAAELGAENGYLVYSVEVVGAGGTVTDVKVDAGDGKVLARETGEGDQNDGEGDQNDKEDSAAVQGSIRSVPSEQLVKQTLSGLAKVSMADAVKSAQASFPGTVLKAELEDEDGFLVIGVEIAGAKGDHTDVKIDAGNGRVLKHDSEDQESEGKDSEQDGGD